MIKHEVKKEKYVNILLFIFSIFKYYNKSYMKPGVVPIIFFAEVIYFTVHNHFVLWYYHQY